MANGTGFPGLWAFIKKAPHGSVLYIHLTDVTFIVGSYSVVVTSCKNHSVVASVALRPVPDLGDPYFRMSDQAKGLFLEVLRVMPPHAHCLCCVGGDEEFARRCDEAIRQRDPRPTQGFLSVFEKSDTYIMNANVINNNFGGVIDISTCGKRIVVSAPPSHVRTEEYEAFLSGHGLTHFETHTWTRRTESAHETVTPPRL